MVSNTFALKCHSLKVIQVMLSTSRETSDVIVKLGDFGLSTFVEEGKAPSTYAGTKEYLAPVSVSSRNEPSFC
jgi:serine/threonine protein kinase